MLQDVTALELLPCGATRLANEHVPADIASGLGMARLSALQNLEENLEEGYVALPPGSWRPMCAPHLSSSCGLLNSLAALLLQVAKA